MLNKEKEKSKEANINAQVDDKELQIPKPDESKTQKDQTSRIRRKINQKVNSH